MAICRYSNWANVDRDCPGKGGSVTAICNNNGKCEGAENTSNCPADCPPPARCGDNICDVQAGENCATCEADCKAEWSPRIPNGFFCCGGGRTGHGCRPDVCNYGTQLVCKDDRAG